MTPVPEEKKFPAAQAKVWHSQELFNGTREVLIEHDSTYYRLMITKAGKLILNK